MDLDITRLKERAQAATPGPWHVAMPGRDSDFEASVKCDATGDRIFDCTEDTDALFIAAANPAAILELIARLERADASTFGGYVIEHADGDRWRTLDSIGMPDWTDDKAKALCFSLHEHADRFACDDPEDVRIVAAQAEPPVPPLHLEQHEREALNYLGTALKTPHWRAAVDRALVICDHYAGRPQLTGDHARLHESMLAEAAAPIKPSAQESPRTDREALRYMMEQFDREYFVCSRCQHEEPTANCDSAIFLRDYLSRNPHPPRESFITREQVCALLDVCRDKMREINAVYEKLLAGEAGAPAREGVQL